MAYPFTMPKQSLIGENALESSGQQLRSLGKKALLVTGKNVTKSGAVDRLVALLEACGMEHCIFNDIPGEPTDSIIEAGVNVYRSEKCDCLIGLGGGSPLDSTKAIAAMSVLPGSLADYMGKELTGNLPPFALLPTTAGTGSEATKYTVVTHTATNTKMLLKGEALLPRLAIVDPSLARTAPPEVVAATGMDALTHAVEAFTSRQSNPLTELWALDAIRRIFRYLPVSYRDRENFAAREEMALAAYQAGVCINNASVTLVHGMSRPIGAVFHIPHGISNAMLLHCCMAYALDGCYDRFAQIARTIGAAGAATPDKEAAEAFLQALKTLCDALAIPTLAQYGVNRTAFEAAAEKMARDALASGSPANTRKSVDKETILQIYAKLWQ